MVDNVSFTELPCSEDASGMFLTFFIDGQLFGVPVSQVLQIMSVQPVTTVPEFPPFAKGIINLRGEIIPIVNTRLCLSKPEVPYTETTCFVITAIGDVSVGFIVDAVDEVMQIEPESILPPPPVTSRSSSTYLTGIYQDAHAVILLLDLQRFLSAEQFMLLASGH